MAGPIILSNRRKALLDSMQGFGDTLDGLNERKRKQQLEGEDRLAASQDRALRNRSLTAAADAGDMQLADLKRRDSARQEAEGLAGDLAGFGQAVPDSAIDTGNTLPGMARMQSPAPAPVSADGLKDRIRASWMNAEARSKGEASAFTAADIKRQRDEAAAKGARESQKFSLDLDKQRADIEGAQAGTTEKQMNTRKTKMEIDKLEKQMNAAGGPTKAITEDNRGVWNQLFTGYRQDTQSTKDSLGQIRKLEALVNGSATGASDIATLYTFIRSFDSPNSAVREAEANMGQEAAGALNRILNLPEKYKSGRILPDTVRKEMLQAVQTIKADHERFLTSANGRYGRLATAGGLDPSLIVDEEFMATQKAGSAPAAPPPGGTDRRSLAQQAINDPEASESEKAQARRILGIN
jgi:hypothetical protein